jgi:hypothetical protein
MRSSVGAITLVGTSPPQAGDGQLVGPPIMSQAS